MINREASKKPVASLPAPPHPTASIAEAKAKFDRVAEQWAAKQGEVDDAKRERADVAAAGIRDAAEAYLAGRKAVDPVKREQELAAKAQKLEAEEQALRIAVDAAGNQYAEAIAADRDQYAENNRVKAQTSTAEVDAALVTLRNAIGRLAAERAAVQWIETFDVDQARLGRARKFAGGRADVDTTELRREGRMSPFVLLDVLQTITQPRPEPEPRVGAAFGGGSSVRALGPAVRA